MGHLSLILRKQPSRSLRLKLLSVYLPPWSQIDQRAAQRKARQGSRRSGVRRGSKERPQLEMSNWYRPHLSFFSQAHFMALCDMVNVFLGHIDLDISSIDQLPTTSIGPLRWRPPCRQAGALDGGLVGWLWQHPTGHAIPAPNLDGNISTVFFSNLFYLLVP